MFFLKRGDAVARADPTASPPSSARLHANIFKPDRPPLPINLFLPSLPISHPVPNNDRQPMDDALLHGDFPTGHRIRRGLQKGAVPEADSELVGPRGRLSWICRRCVGGLGRVERVEEGEKRWERLRPRPSVAQMNGVSCFFLD